MGTSMEIAIIIIVCHNGNTMRQLPRELYIDWNVDIANVAAKNTKNNKQKEMVRTRKTLKKIISRIVFGSGRCWWQKELAYYDLLINDVIRTVRLKKERGGDMTSVLDCRHWLAPTGSSVANTLVLRLTTKRWHQNAQTFSTTVLQ